MQNKPNFDIPEDFEQHIYPKLAAHASFALVNRIHYSMELRALMARLHRPLSAKPHVHFPTESVADE